MEQLEEIEEYEQGEHTESGQGQRTPCQVDDTDNRRSRKRYRSTSHNDLPPHNTDCDCSTSEGDNDADDTLVDSVTKRHRTGEVNSTAVHDEFAAGQNPLQWGASPLHAVYEDGGNRIEFLEEQPSVGNTSSTNILHRTILDITNLDEVIYLSDSSSFNISEDMNFTRLPPRPRLWRRNDPPHVFEFEVGSFPPSLENQNPIEDLTTSTEDEFANELQNNSSSSSSDWSAKDAAERGSFADSSDSESDTVSKKSGLSTDSELSEQDAWFCSRCNAKTNIPYFRHCLRCFNLRRNWLPPRPKGKGKARPPLKVHRQRLRALYTYPPEKESIPCSSPDEEPASSHSSKPILSTSTRSTSPSSSVPGTTQTAPGSSHDLSLKLQSALDAPPVSVALAADARDEPLCIICMGREKNAAFVHGKSAHFCCCYQCGDKILKRAGKCPVCRKRILRVVKIIS